MKRSLFIIAIAVFEAVIIIATSCSKKKDGSKEGEYTEFLSMFSDSTCYAVVNVDGHKVLLVSDETYQNEDANHKPIITALAAQVYSKDEHGKMVCCGEVRSQGTLYPISLSDKKLVTAGHHFIEKYSVDGNPLSLTLREDANATFTNDGNATYSYENRDKNEYIDNCPQEKFDSLMNTQSTPIEFSHK